jgi:predicted transcriptional regulator
MTDENTSGVLPAGGKRRRRVGAPRRPEHRKEPVVPDSVTIELSKAQVDQIIRAAGEGGTMSVLLSALKDPKWTLAVDSEEWAYPVQMEDRRLSRSLLSGLLVLSCFSAEAGSLGIAELARRLDMNTSTTHRYVTTLLAVGLLERDPTTRRYRLAA